MQYLRSDGPASAGWGKMCCGRTPMETFRDGKSIWQDKLIN